MKKKQFVSALLAFAMVFGTGANLPKQADFQPATLTADAGEYQNLTYEKIGTYIEITGYTGTPETLEIPEKIEGLPVQQIGYGAFIECESLTSVVLPESMKGVGADAFLHCSNLISVTLPDGLETISNNALSGCDNLKTVTIPESVTKVGDGAFTKSGLESVTINCSSTGMGAFEGCSNLTTVTLGDKFQTLSYAMFQNCNSLTTFEVSEGNPYFTSIDGALYDKDVKSFVLCPSARTTMDITEGVTTSDVLPRLKRRGLPV